MGVKKKEKQFCLAEEKKPDLLMHKVGGEGGALLGLIGNEGYKILPSFK